MYRGQAYTLQRAFITRKNPAPVRTSAPAAAAAGRAAPRDPAFERRVQEIGAEYLRNAREAGAGVFSGSLSVFKDKLMESGGIMWLIRLCLNFYR